MKQNEFKTVMDALTTQIRTTLDKYQWFELLNSVEEKKHEVKSYVVKGISEQLNLIKTNEEKTVYEKFRMVSILFFIIRESHYVTEESYTPAIVKYFGENWQRMLTSCKNGDGWSRQTDDIFWKDLALARRKMFPVNAHVIETYSGFGFSQAFRNSISQKIRFLCFLIRSGGKKGYFQIHLHVPNLDLFGEKGRIECYMEIASMLAKNPNIKGAFGISWFYDPQLKTISPRLSYLHEFPLKGGAELFHIGYDQTGAALARSGHRRKLCEAGHYLPQSYLLVWPRKQLLPWASQRQQQN